MNSESLEGITRHVKDVPRIEACIANLTQEEIETLVAERETVYSIRWAQCDRSFRMLFMALNRDNRWPEDSFKITLGRETVGDATIDTCARIWRDRKQQTFNIKPYTKQGRIENHEFTTETFGDTYNYRYGTHRSHGAKLTVNHDGVEPRIELSRVDGYLVDDPASKAAIYLSALDNYVAPQLENTENTLILIHQALLDESLNPDHAAKLRIHHT